MYGLRELKPTIKVKKNSIECPVKGCSMEVERQRKVFKREQKFQCPIHKIYISPTTFEYETEKENLLWFDNIDEALYTEIKRVKRESRIARDNSEDALTWNVFRFLDKLNLLPDLLSQLSKKEINETELILWSYSPKEQSSMSLLNNARVEFGETIARGSEPDIIILTDKVLYFIEAKHFSNKDIWSTTTPKVIEQIKKYEEQISKRKDDIIEAYTNYVNILNSIFGLKMPPPLKIEDKVSLLIFGFDQNQKDGRLQQLILDNPEYKACHVYCKQDKVNPTTLWNSQIL